MLATRPLLALNLARSAPLSRVGLRAALPAMACAPKLPTAFARSASTTSANAQTTKLTQQQNLDLLNQQRAQRPSSPHFTIYQPQITWYLSIINRITGTGLSVCKYLPCRITRMTCKEEVGEGG